MNKKRHRKRIISYILILIVTTIIGVLAFSDVKSKNVQAIEMQNNNDSVENTPIMGTGSLSRGKMLQILYNNNEDKDLSSLGEFVDFTIEEAGIEGVNYDIAFSLMMVETGYLNFNGEVYAYQNNFGGLGATGSPYAKRTDENGRPTNGESFTNVREGIRAVVQHLKAYASTDDLKQTCVDKRFEYVKRGCIIYVEYLGIKENPDGYGWAAGEGYGTKIKNLVANTSVEKVVLSQISSVNVTGLCKVGKPVTIEASATPSENSLYRIWIKDNGNWKIVSDYSTNAKVSYTPTHDGSYAVEVDVKNKFSNKNYDDVWSKAINIVKPDLVKIATASVTGIMKIGTPITIAATTTPSEDALYRIWIKDNGDWKIISDYSTNHQVSYIPTHDGQYAVEVDVKNMYSTNNYDSTWSKQISIAKPDSVKITDASVTGLMKIGKPVQITATVTPSEDALYRIWIKDNGVWKIISDYSTNSHVSFTPIHEGQYAVEIDVKNKKSTNNYDSTWSNIISIAKLDLVKITNVSVNGTMQVNNPITIEVTATPSEDALYRIWIRDNGIWKIISDYSTDSQVSYTPTHEGQYAVEVDVKNKLSNNSYDSVWSSNIKIVDTNISKLINTEITGDMKAGKSITISALASPTNDTLYRIWIKDNGNWKIISDYSTNSQVSYTPTHEGQYAVEVDVKNKNSGKSYDDVWSKIISIVKSDSVKITNVSIIGLMQVGNPITIEVTATPIEDTLYRIWIRDNGTWKIISDYSTNVKVLYTPIHEGQYAVEVDAKNKLSKNNYDSVWSGDIKIVDPNISKLTNIEMSGDMKAGNTITISASATPENDTLYRMWIKDNGNWKIISDYSTSNKVNYIPSHSGIYVVQIDVKNKNSIKNYDDVYNEQFIVTEEQKAEIDTVEITGMVNLGKTMTISAKSKNTEGTLYRIWIKENGNWILISDYSTNSMVSYIPKSKGPYNVQVDVKNQYSNNNYDDVWSQTVYTKPKDITIVLDAGHGLSEGKYDPGAQATHYGITYVEAELNLYIAQKTYNELIKKGYNVIMTRISGSKDVDFIDRPKYANNQVADLYISIHQNSYTSSAAYGLEVLYTSKSMDESVRKAVMLAGIQDPIITHSSKVDQSVKLATILEKELAVSTGFKSRGVKDQNLYIGRNTYMPSILIECGFISNSDEAKKLSQDGYQDTISRVIAISVDQYYN